MTTRKDISLNVIADISKYQEQFAKIPGFTEKQAAKAAAALEKKMSKAAVNTAKQATRAAEKAGRAASRAAEDSQRSAIEAGKGLAELAGVPADKFEKFRAVLAGISTPMGQMAVVAVGSALAVGGLAVAMTALGAASISAIRASDELLEKFEDLSEIEGFSIPDEDVESINRANAALDSVEITGERLVVLFAGKVAPSVNSVSIEIVKLGLLAGDALDGMGSGAGIVAEMFHRLGRVIVGAISDSTGRLLELASVGAKVARFGGFEEMATGLESISNAAGSIPLSMIEVGFDGVTIATANYQERAEELVGTVQRLNAEEKEEKETKDDSTKSSKAKTDALKEEKEAQDAMGRAMGKAATIIERDAQLRKQNTDIILSTTQHEMTALGKAAKAREDQLRKVREIEDERIANAAGNQQLIMEAEVAGREARLAVETQFEEEKTRILAEQSEARVRITEQEGKDIGNRLREFTVQTLGAMNEALMGMSQLAAESGSKRQARNLFRLGKATAAALTVVNTIASAQKAIFDLGPVLGPVAATAITAAGFARVALIRNQKMPQFYRGTSNVQPSGGSRDAVPAMLHEGEAVLNRRAAQSMGRSQIEALNASGRSGSQTVVAISQVNHRQFRDFYRDDRLAHTGRPE